MLTAAAVPPSPMPAPVAGHRVLRFALAVAGIAVAATAAFVVAAYVADRATTRPGELVAPTYESPVWVGGPSAVVDGASDPGAVADLAPAGPVIEGIPGGTFVLPPELVGAGAGATQGPAGEPGRDTGAGTGATSGAGPVVAPLVGADDAPALADTLARADLAAPPTFRGFVDLCTTGATPCPFGLAASVKSVSYTSGEVPMHVKIWPGVTKAQHPALRCDPGFATPWSYPVVVTVDQPVAQVWITLTTADGHRLDDLVLPASPGERAWYDQQIAAGKVVGTDLGNGQQYCASLRTEGDAANLAALVGKTLASPVTYRIWTRGVPSVGHKGAEAAVEVAAPVMGPRPPTVVVPLSGHVAQVVTPELPVEGGSRSRAWLREMTISTETVDLTCELPSPPDHDLPQPELKSVDPGLLTSPTYPFSTAFSAYAVRNLVLAEATRYALCIAWSSPLGEDREAVELGTPDGFRVELYAAGFRAFAQGPPVKEGFDISAPGAGCWRHRLKGDIGMSGSSDAGPYRTFCRSNGLPWPVVTDLRMERVVGGTEVVTIDMGHRAIITPTWCQTLPGSEPVLVPTPDGSWSTGVCSPTTWNTSVQWRDQNVLCGGGGCGPEYTRAELDLAVQIVEGNVNGRRDPRDWIIKGPPKLYNPGQGSAAPAGGMPGPSG